MRVFAAGGTGVIGRRLVPHLAARGDQVTATTSASKLGLLAQLGAEEYSVAFEALYPYPRDRRAYIEQQVRKGSASYPHRLLASLISSKQTPCVAATNFDQLIERTTVVTDELIPPPDQADITVSAFFSRLLE